LIELCSGFDVLDVVLVDANKKSPTIYGIQITRSKDPFLKHHTTDTCSANSKKKLQNLWESIQNHLDIQNPTIIFTMIAPNCENDKFKPTAGHENVYYFSPAKFVLEYFRKNNGQPVPKRAKLAEAPPEKTDRN
jgi:hypothetical protein